MCGVIVSSGKPRAAGSDVWENRGPTQPDRAGPALCGALIHHITVQTGQVSRVCGCLEYACGQGGCMCADSVEHVCGQGE